MYCSGEGTTISVEMYGDNVHLFQHLKNQAGLDVQYIFPTVNESH